MLVLLRITRAIARVKNGTRIESRRSTIDSFLERNLPFTIELPQSGRSNNEFTEKNFLRNNGVLLPSDLPSLERPKDIIEQLPELLPPPEFAAIDEAESRNAPVSPQPEATAASLASTKPLSNAMTSC